MAVSNIVTYLVMTSSASQMQKLDLPHAPVALASTTHVPSFCVATCKIRDVVFNVSVGTVREREDSDDFSVEVAPRSSRVAANAHISGDVTKRSKQLCIDSTLIHVSFDLHLDFSIRASELLECNFLFVIWSTV